MGRSRALDVIRGIAILMVLIWHYLPRGSGTPEFLVFSTRLFWSGVDLFFVLSGFLIAGILLDNAQAKNYFSVFYIRRGVRILPLYLLLCLVFGIVLHYHPQIIRTSFNQHLPFWSYPTFTQNFLYAGRNFFNDPWMDVTWSLAVEEQFYIFLSILIRNTSRRNAAIVSILLILLAPILRIFSTDLQAYILPLQRADSLMLGVLLAILWRSERGKQLLYKYAPVIRWSLLFFLAGAVYLVYRDTSYGDVIGHFWLALLYGQVVVLALTSDPLKQGPVFKNRVLEWLGLRSYGIYLLHRPIAVVTPVFLRIAFDFRPIWWVNLLMKAAVLFFISELSYRLLEKPIMELGHRFKYHRPVAGSPAPAGRRP